MLGQSEAINKAPPHAVGAIEADGTPDILAAEAKVAVGVASTAAALVLSGGIPMTGCWVTFSCDADAYIHFGPTSSLSAASSTISTPMTAGFEYEWRINDKDAYFRIIRKTADGVLSRRRSNR